MKRATIRISLSLALGLGLGLTMVLFVVSSQAAPANRLPLRPGNPVVYPAGSTHTASPNATVSITYDEPISLVDVSTQTFAVYAMQTGLLMETYGVHSGTISLTPTQPFKPGELVQVSATTGTLSLIDGQGPVSPTVWSFRVAVLGGSGVFTDSGQSMASVSSDAVALGDLDGDGDLDVFAGDQGGVNKVWLNDGAGNFSDSGQSLGSGAFSVALGDVDGDSDLDIFFTRRFGPTDNKVYLNDGMGNFTDSGQSLGNSDSWAMALGDVDGDGDLDAVVANAVSGQSNKIWLNDGMGVFTDTHSLPSLGSEGRGVTLGDLDGDGDLDAFVGKSGANQVWLNDGRGNFTDTLPGLGNSLSGSAGLGDLDGDGDLDAFVGNCCGSFDGKVWLNDGAGNFSDSGQSLPGGGSLGDVDGDGDLDILAPKNGANQVWLNDGMGNFTDSGQRLGDSDSRCMPLGDLDGDGDLDIYVGNGSSQANKVWLNQGGFRHIYLPLVLRQFP